MFAGLTEVAGGIRNPFMRAVARLGEMVWAQWDELRHAAAVIGTALYVGVRPRSWVRPVRNMLARQVLAVGAEPLGFVCGVAVLVWISVVVQLSFWAGAAGQSQPVRPDGFSLRPRGWISFR